MQLPDFTPSISDEMQIIIKNKLAEIEASENGLLYYSTKVWCCESEG
jgi:hypothetical protein